MHVYAHAWYIYIYNLHTHTYVYLCVCVRTVHIEETATSMATETRLSELCDNLPRFELV